MIGELRKTVRVQFDPLLAEASREAIQAIDADDSASATLKKSVRRLLVDQRDFSNSFFTAVDSHIDAAIDELFTGGKDKPAQPASSKSLSLSLVEYDEMEEAMVIDRFSSRIRNAADSTFTPLTQRLAKALQIPGLGDRENPFHPVRFCRALGDAIDKLGFKGDQRHSVMKAFDVSLLKPLVAVYTALNNDLEGKGVQEGGAASSYKPTGFRNTMIGSAGAPARTTQGGGPAPGSMTGTTAEQLLSALYQRMQVPTVPGGGAARPLPSMPHSQLPSTPLFDRVDQVTGSPMMSPGFVITGSASTPLAANTPVQFAMIDPGLLASINEVQRLNALATMSGKSGAAAQMISERDEAHLRSHVAEKATKQIDKLTIELVGMLFDRIHQDKHLPAEIKTAISRLQFPIMKIALADSDLFVSPVQPARRLMDRIASTGIGWRPGRRRQRPLSLRGEQGGQHDRRCDQRWPTDLRESARRVRAIPGRRARPRRRSGDACQARARGSRDARDHGHQFGDRHPEGVRRRADRIVSARLSARTLGQGDGGGHFARAHATLVCEKVSRRRSRSGVERAAEDQP